SADGILHRNKRTREYLEFEESERPFGVQLFGGDPERLAEGARCVAEWVRPDFIDLNFGCPVNKVVCKHGGSALLKDCPLLERVARAVVAAVAPVPVTAKIRIGWDAQSVNAVETSQLLEDCGVTRIAVHGRTKSQGYSGEADWGVIARVVSAVSIPVIGNGDISSVEIAARRLQETGVSGLMLGRAAMSSPWIFRQIRSYLETGEIVPEPSLEERWELILDHARQEVAWRGDENFALRAMRSRLMAYSRGMVGGKHLREKFSGLTSIVELEDIAEKHLHGES
ncbi:MAG: tRNA dihydrouridine synthase, partial [Chthoniobacterales bacterium]